MDFDRFIQAFASSETLAALGNDPDVLVADPDYILSLRSILSNTNLNTVANLAMSFYVTNYVSQHYELMDALNKVRF